MAGCEWIFTDTVSGRGARWTTQERVGLSEALQFMRARDALEESFFASHQNDKSERALQP